MKTVFAAAGLLLAAIAATAAPGAARAHEEAHHLAIHVDDNDPAKMNIALNNAKTVSYTHLTLPTNREV